MVPHTIRVKLLRSLVDLQPIGSAAYIASSLGAESMQMRQQKSQLCPTLRNEREVFTTY
ncbi:hypothetical protein DPMN_047645 [Dreissena polymorpha]|uniref:Uncharacterized protein n=1 Tax=Dreissena polymorpha TaxID=45954 RepID=A0A9D4DBT8_DREPO|nr:hypothetical protein DPMN_047645 [Dreissena polymorpha]